MHRANVSLIICDIGAVFDARVQQLATTEQGYNVS